MSSASDLLLKLKTAPDVDLEVPGFVGQLEPHQKVAVLHAILARQSLLVMSVGLGKTIVSIAADQKLRQLGAVGRTLVLCQSGKRFDWQAEFGRFVGREGVLVEGDRHDRAERWLAGQRNGLTIASYEQARIDLVEKQTLPTVRRTVIHLPSDLLRVLRYDLIVLDEVSVFKTWATLLNLALTHLIVETRPPFCLGLSATPIQKSVDDIFTIVDKVVPGWLGTKPEFDSRYVVKQMVAGRYSKTVGVRNADELKTRLYPIYLRRETHEVYPGRTVYRWKLRRVVMSERQAQQYGQVVDGVTADQDRKTLFKSFVELEKAVDTVAHFGPDHISTKLDDLKSLLEGELSDEKVVIFSKHLLMLHECSTQVLQPLGLDHVFYTGEERDMRVRETARHRFQHDPVCRAILVSTAAEMGFDLHASRYIIFLNHVYNPARTLQLVGRIDRPVVQTSQFVCSIHYVTVGTFEEALIPRLHREAELARDLLGQVNRLDGLRDELVDSMSRDDLFYLIKGAT